MSTCRLIFISTTLVLCNAIAKEDPIVETKYGNVRGREEYSKSYRGYYAFKGIPYARPPIGSLRFKPPLEPLRWSNILTTQEDAPHCLQKNYLFSNPRISGSEDCLYLNVYTPRLRARRYSSRNRLLPVMVFIHWGGFFTGYSSSDYLGPEYFMDKNVVLVTFNYRLGVLGFFSTTDDAAPGNYGLKDQVVALRWVQNNIENFGGNRDNVTIFGQSAGGASVSYHMLSPESRNLFHQGISQSGTSLALWAKPYSSELQFSLAQTQAQFVGCPDISNTFAIVDCLRNVSADDLINSGDKFKFFSVDPLNVYTPSVERRTVNNLRPFITKQPIDYIRNKEFYNVPWILGVVDSEGLIRAEPLLRQPETRKNLIQRFNDLMPNLMGLSLSTSIHEISNLWQKIKKFYFGEKGEVDITDINSIKSFIDLYSDRSFTYSIYQTALFHSIQGQENLWFYYFNYSGQYSYGNAFAATDNNINYDWGVSHCDDLLYLFKTPAIFPEFKKTNDKLMIEVMTELWTNFAKYGHPTPENSFLSISANWKKLDNYIHGNLKKEIKYLSISGSHDSRSPPRLSMEYGFYEDRFKFWEQLPLAENIKELNQTNHLITP